MYILWKKTGNIALYISNFVFVFFDSSLIDSKNVIEIISTIVLHTSRQSEIKDTHMG
jgi:hypothetical protein